MAWQAVACELRASELGSVVTGTGSARGPPVPEQRTGRAQGSAAGEVLNPLHTPYPTTGSLPPQEGDRIMITISHRRQGGSKRKCKRPVDTRYDNTDRYIAQHGREVSRAFHKYVQETYGIFEVDTWLGRAIATGRAAPWEDVINAAAGGGQDELRYRDRFGAEAHGQLIDAIGRSIRGADFCPWIELALAIGEPHPWEGGSPLGVPEDPRDLLEEVAANPGDPVAAIAAYRAARRVRQLEAWRRPPLQPPSRSPRNRPPRSRSPRSRSPHRRQRSTR